MNELLNDKEAITIARIFNESRERVWKAWTEPERLKQWWGPKEFTAPYSSIDLRVGGAYLFGMRGPDGKNYWATGMYREVVPLIRLVFTDSFADERGNAVPASHYGLPGTWPLHMLVAIDFEDAGGKTRMILRHYGIPTETVRADTRKSWNESFDKLAKILVHEPEAKPAGPAELTVCAEPGKQEIVLTSVFDAPRALVFAAQTDPALIPRWWGPKRFTTIVDRMDLKPGGIWRFIHQDRSGKEFRFHGIYHAILAPERIVFTFEYEGSPGHVSLETVRLRDLDGRTEVSDSLVFQSVEDRDAMLNAGMVAGASESMDRLAELVEELKKEKQAA